MELDRINSRPYNNMYTSIVNSDAFMLTGILILVIGVIVLLKMYFSLKNDSRKRYILPICMIAVGAAATILSML
jgi:lipoprotein signal peptidase